MKKNIFKSKKLLLGTFGAAIIATAPIVLIACSKVTQELLNKTVSTGDGWTFAKNANTNYDINTMSTKALESDAGQKALTNYVISKLSLDWFERVSKQKDQTIIKRAYEKQIKAVNDEYKELVKSRKSSNGADFAIKFQQEDLDPVGGTESAWKEKKMLDWAKSELISKLFETSYLAVSKNDNIVNYPNLTDLVEAVQNSTNDKTKASFVFSPNAKGTLINSFVDGEYAKFQKFVYDKWLEIENPYVVNMSLWKYGTPDKGINTIYKSTATGVDDTSSANPGKYQFPYFQTKGSSVTNGGTISKFVNFVNGAKTNSNFLSIDSGLKGIGIRNIDTKTYTEDSSTLILAKNGSIYNDLYIEFAAASSYLFNQSIGTTTSKDSSNKLSTISNIEKDVVTTETDGMDAITANFISKTAPTNAINPSTIKISTTLAKEIINDNGPMKDLANSDLYVIDAFKGKTSDGLDDFLFIRDEAGVHAIAIEGKTFISKANGDLNQAKKNAGNIVLFHYFGKKIDESELDIDINKELSTFFGSNTEYLISEYIKNNNEQKLFDLSSSKIDDNLKNIYQGASTYIFEISKIDRVKDYNEKMFSQKQTYANSYGIDTKKNGLASTWIFSKTKNIFDVANTVNLITNDPFDKTNGSYKKYIDFIKPYIQSLSLTSLKSDFEGFKYSQYILSNNYAINSILIAFGADSNSMGDSIKIDTLKSYLGNDFDLSTLKFNNSFNNNDANVGKINDALINSFYSTTFDGLSNKWTQYTSNDTFSKTTLDNYKLELYKKTLNVQTSSGITNNLSMLTTIATAKYLLENNGQKFIEYLQNKITIGKDFYVAWIDSFNNELSPDGNNSTKAMKTVEELLKVETISQNVTNNYDSVYQGMKNGSSTSQAQQINNLITLDKNNSKSYFSTSSNYYSHTEKRLGYKGLIDSDSAIDSEALKERLFKNKSLDNTSKKGILYSYVSRQKLEETINNFTYDSEVQGLAEKIQLITGGAINVSDIFKDATTPAEKKSALVTLVKDTSKITDDMFNKRDNYIGVANSGTPTTYNPIPEFNSSIYSGAFVYQINQDNVKDWNTLKTALGNEEDVVYNLLIEAAKDTANQDSMISNVVSNQKFTMYDSRINTQLGPKWLSNWKG